MIEIPDKNSSNRQRSLKTVESLKMKFLLVVLIFFHYSQTLDLILRVPEELLLFKTVNAGNFRLDYTPNLGYPIANTAHTHTMAKGPSNKNFCHSTSFSIL